MSTLEREHLNEKERVDEKTPLMLATSNQMAVWLLEDGQELVLGG